MQSPEPQELARRLAETPALAPLLEAAAQLHGVHLVGGAVRDVLLGGTPTDFDLVVEGDAAPAALALAERLGGDVTLHERFGTATVSAPELIFDVAGARSETYAAPGALPDVRPASLDEDLRRRDFTVNAMATPLWADARGTLRAAPNALEDIAAGTLRVMHDRSFLDDPTRLLRLVRYAVRLDFSSEEHTAQLAQDAIRGGAPATVSSARIGAELRLLLAEPRALEMLERCADSGLDRAVHPSFGLSEPALARRALELLPPDGRRDLLLLAAACRAFERDALGAWLDDLELHAAEREVVIAAALQAPTLAGQLEPAASRSELAAVLRGRPVEQVALAGAEGPADAARLWLERLRHVSLEIGGADLLSAGVPEGPEVGAALAAALAAKLDGECDGRDAELEAALAALGRTGAG